jgi:hypothetical protein
VAERKSNRQEQLEGSSSRHVIWTPSLFLDARASQWLRQKDGPAQDWTRGEGKRRQTPWDLVPAGFFRGSFYFYFYFLFYTRYARPAVERRTPPTSEHIVHHGGNGWRETGGRGQVKTEPVTSETVAAAECGDAELLKLVLCSACGCSQCDQKVSFSPKNSCSSI